MVHPLGAHGAETFSEADSGDALFEPTTVLARLEELRKRLIVSIASLFAAFVLCFSFSRRLYAILMGPLKETLPADAVLAAVRIPEIFMVHLQMALFAAVFLAAPVWLYQIWRFASLLRPLKRTFLPVLFLGCGLLLAGAAFGHFVLFPYAVRFLTTVGSPSTRLVLSIGSVFSFYAHFVLGLGLAFQIPTIVLILSMMDLVTPRFLVRQLRLIILIVFALAAILTPTPDLVTQSLLALPMLALYLASIVLCWLVTRRRG